MSAIVGPFSVGQKKKKKKEIKVSELNRKQIKHSKVMDYFLFTKLWKI